MVGGAGGSWRAPRAAPAAARVASRGMLDHVFLDAVRVLERAFDDSLLQRPRHEDRLLSDLLSGDVVWETSVALPGDGRTPRVLADVTLDWSTWSQSAWRSWVLGETVEETPEIGVEVVLRIQRLAAIPERRGLLDVVERLGAPTPHGLAAFERAGVVGHDEIDVGAAAVEITFEGEYRLRDPEDLPRQGLFGESALSDPADDDHDVGNTHPAAASPAASPGASRPPASPAGAGGPDHESAGGPADPDDPARSAEPTAPQRAAAPAAGTPPGPERRGSLSPALARGLADLAGWVASALVRLGDVEAAFLPPDPGDP